MNDLTEEDLLDGAKTITLDIKKIIIQMAYSGHMLSKICEKLDLMPYDIISEMEKNPTFKNVYIEAERHGHDRNADTLIDIHTKTWDAADKKLYSDNLKWVLGNRSKKYNNSIDVNVTTVNINVALDEAQARVVSAVAAPNTALNENHLADDESLELNEPCLINSVSETNNDNKKK